METVFWHLSFPSIYLLLIFIQKINHNKQTKWRQFSGNFWVFHPSNYLLLFFIQTTHTHTNKQTQENKQENRSWKHVLNGTFHNNIGFGGSHAGCVGGLAHIVALVIDNHLCYLQSWGSGSRLDGDYVVWCQQLLGGRWTDKCIEFTQRTLLWIHMKQVCLCANKENRICEDIWSSSKL